MPSIPVSGKHLPCVIFQHWLKSLPPPLKPLPRVVYSVQASTEIFPRLREYRPPKRLLRALLCQEWMDRFGYKKEEGET